MYMKALSLLWALSLVSGNVLYFKPHSQQDEVVMEFDQDDSHDVTVQDPVGEPESRVRPKEESGIGERPFKGVMCPGGTSECPDDTTCCKLANGRYGCCPYPEAVCCSDLKHCCRQGYTCNLAKGCCEQGNSVMPLKDKFPAFQLPDKQNEDSTPQKVLEASVIADTVEICPGGVQSCESGYSCCRNRNGSYSCCGYSPAHCCEDQIHCCPAQYKCLRSGRCEDKNGFQLPWSRKVEATASKVKANIVCPDKKTQCAEGKTCCLKGVNVFGCCPLKNAVCCSDKKHCCPYGYKCGPKMGTCMQGYHVLDLSMDASLHQSDELTPDQTVKETISPDIICPDKKSECKTGETCCKTQSGYGCCPSHNAVCCSDMKHCCPEGDTCDVGSGHCIKSNGLSTAWLEKTQSRPVATELSDVICPDGKQCPSGNTCCSVGDNKYGCCPRPDAVCCDDKKHCCPKGHKCDTSAGKCISSNGLSTAWLEKTESRPVATKSPDIICPDGTSMCPSGDTCCLVGDNKYGCCPRPNAVCCADKIHCCPENTKCDPAEGKCIPGNGLPMDWLEKTESRPVTTKLSDVICPDGMKCPIGNTCCLVGDKKYGCCPRPNAVCCEDKIHCCPENTKCDPAEGKCIPGNGLPIDWLEKTESFSIENKSPAMIVPANNDIQELQSIIDCPGGGSCPDNNTCCKNSAGEEGCCPYAKAVCCPDGKYCCPQGYICDTLPMICRMPEGINRLDFNTNLFLQRLANKQQKRGGKN